MKHVGVNVAADPLFTVSYTGTNGALVVVTADDPSLHSSQNEQDNRHYARSAKIPMLEPADSQEAKDFVKKAFELSALFDTPVFLRTTTRVSHSKSIVLLEDPEKPVKKEVERLDPVKYVMVPHNARMRRVAVEERMQRLRKYVETMPENWMEINDHRFGIVTAGMPYNYAKEVFPDFSYLKLGMVYPLPEKMIKSFAAKVGKIYVVEELDPFLEEQLKAMGIKTVGKDIFPYSGEFDPGVIAEAIKRRSAKKVQLPPVDIPPRPPNLCPGCPHRGLFYVLGKSKAIVTGDIGCYTLSFMKPSRSTGLYLHGREHRDGPRSKQVSRHEGEREGGRGPRRFHFHPFGHHLASEHRLQQEQRPHRDRRQQDDRDDRDAAAPGDRLDPSGGKDGGIELRDPCQVLRHP